MELDENKQTIKGKIAALLEQAAVMAQNSGLLPSVGLPEITVERPQNIAHGDFACSFPLKLARAARVNPLEIAQQLAGYISKTPEVNKIEVAPPGFINFTLEDDWIARQVDTILKQDDSYGNIDLGEGLRVQLEFVSVNPTGPLHVGHGRGAVLGSTLANVLSAESYSVEKEYLINDAGAQMNAFYRSLYERYKEALGISAEIPPDGYHSDYVIELAKEIIEERGNEILSLSPEEAIDRLAAIGLEKVMGSIKYDLELVGVDFDVWFSEKTLYQEGQYQKVMLLLKQGGYIDEKEGATWFVSSALGEDKDNVLVRTNGTPTYFASDVAYHYNKFLERGFNKVINIWGADHQGHVPRMKAVLGALGIDPSRLEVIITQMVTLRRGGVEVKASKRSGDMVTLRDVVEEVGSDACRFFFLARSADSQMEFDLELAKKQSAENPVYYVQYAHARIASIMRLAEERGIDFNNGDVSLLTTEPELALIRKMLQLPEIIELVASNLEPHHLPYYAQELATVFHSFYKQCRVVSDDVALTSARLKLVKAAQIVLVKVLNLMGVNAPERM
jgi:arginyl-tRNA synthetase